MRVGFGRRAYINVEGLKGYQLRLHSLLLMGIPLYL